MWLPGRFQCTGPWIFDVAHNADGARTLAASMKSVGHDSPVVALLCVLGDKDWRAMMDALSGSVDHFVLTDAPTAPRSRAWSLTQALDSHAALEQQEPLWEIGTKAAYHVHHQMHSQAVENIMARAQCKTAAFTLKQDTGKQRQ